MFFFYDRAEVVEMLPGLTRRTLVSDEKLMICRLIWRRESRSPAILTTRTRRDMWSREGFG